jgi:RNA polymerase sigma-70 factor (ECF subfamily)
MEEADIIKGCLNNDRNSQRLLYEKYYSKMMAVCMRYAKDKDEAKDILHEAYMKVFNNLKNFGNKGSFEGWIRRIMVNASIDHIRKKRQEYLIVNTVYAETKGEHLTIEDTSDDDIINGVDIKDVMKAVQQLSPAYRAVFNLYVVDDYTHKEISALLDISEGTSKSNLAKAKFNLRKNLAHLIKQTHETK